MNRTLGAALISGALLSAVVAPPAQARFAPPLGSLGQPPPPPGKLYNHNGVVKLDLAVNNAGSPTRFVPVVSWSARTTKMKLVTGRKCRIEVTFPGTRWPRYTSRNCQGSVTFTNRVYAKPARYAITVQDRVSGSFTTVPFVVEG